MLASPTHRTNDVKERPYAVSTRKERSRELAQKRRTTYKSLMNDMADVLPFSKEVVSQVDYNSRLRLALCFIRMKKLLGADPEDEDLDMDAVCHDVKPAKKSSGLFQDLIVESLDGFLMTCMGDGTIIHLSETIHKHLGLFQSEHIGFSLYDLVHEDDHYEVKRRLSQSESQAMTKLFDKEGSVGCSFFCRMKCSKSKLSNSTTKSPGYKLVYIAGQLRLQDDSSFLTAVIHPVSPPSILEIRMEGNMFVTHYTLDMRCTFYDGRLKDLMGFEKDDLVGHVPFEYHHHEDVAANLQCSKGLMERGEGVSGYYRYINKYGTHVWMQSRGIMMFDSRTGKPSYIVCMNYVISKDEGYKELASRKALPSGQTMPAIMDSARSYDPIPTPRDDSVPVNPYEPPTLQQQRQQLNLVQSENECSISVSTSVSPTESSRSSPDFSSSHSVLSTDLKLRGDGGVDTDDQGYGSSVSFSYHGTSVISPQSVNSCISNEEACGSVFHGSPHSSSCHSPDMAAYEVPTTNGSSSSSHHNLIASLLSANIGGNPSPGNRSYSPISSSVSSPGSSVVNSPVSSTLNPSVPNPYFNLSGPALYSRQHPQLQQPMNKYNTYFQQQPLIVNGSAEHISAQTMRNAYHQMSYNTGGHQLQQNPQLEVSSTVIPPDPAHLIKNLPVLSVEDVQLLISD